jgi:hypothetical protein
MSQKLDLYEQHADEYVARKTPLLVDTRAARYLTIEGEGEPGGKEFQDCVGALYAIAFTIKMAKKFSGHDYHVCKLEGLWSEPDASGQCRWKLMIRTPDFIKDKDVLNAIDVCCQRGKKNLVTGIELETIKEGKCVQALHVGPYSTETDTIRDMEEFAANEGYRLAGMHHEIYLSDPRRVPPERLKTILRHPVVRA